MSRAAHPRGLGGWLVLVHAQIWIGGIILFIMVASLTETVVLATSAQSRVPDADLVPFLQAVSTGILLGMLAAVAITFYGRRRAFPAVFIGYWICGIVVMALDAVVNYHVLHVEPEIPQLIALTGAGVVWISYTLVSRRVRNTFTKVPQWRVFEKDSHWRAVRMGFNIWAFFFAGIWALVKGMPIAGALGVGAAVTLNRLPSDADLVAIPASAALMLIYGFLGNRWLSSRLRRKGYRELGIVRERNGTEAIRRLSAPEAAAGSNNCKEPTAAALQKAELPASQMAGAMPAAVTTVATETDCDSNQGQVSTGTARRIRGKPEVSGAWAVLGLTGWAFAMYGLILAIDHWAAAASHRDPVVARMMEYGDFRSIAGSVGYLTELSWRGIAALVLGISAYSLSRRMVDLTLIAVSIVVIILTVAAELRGGAQRTSDVPMIQNFVLIAVSPLGWYTSTASRAPEGLYDPGRLPSSDERLPRCRGQT